ncbi:hypothetical protein QR90_05710 [Deinococcus radiopugnans]|uniref:Uncharacterized protein n=1 Tax=Deinococcus radiopugnans TaxID=57497 RepID=A0A0A7KJX6_9DEIO|nr:hypothetical protein [Deinococcus radiopugnans]AIZ46492.1 hypothetical protein QR90_05710 [Deinococcus radiopugnans]
MDLLRAIHSYHFQYGTVFALLIPTPYVLATLILMVWSIAPAVKKTISRSFMLWLRLVWVLTLLPAATGVILALGGLKVASATDIGNGGSKYGYLVDPSRNLEHWMYSAFALISLYLIEILVAGRMIDHKDGLKYLPVATLFLYGVAYMIWRVAVLPGSTPGT